MNLYINTKLHNNLIPFPNLTGEKPVRKSQSSQYAHV
jgi:hypothetical protein